jgi:hypothetical protein
MFFFHFQMLHSETVLYKYFGTWYKRCSSVLKFSKHSPFELGTQSLEIASLELFANMSDSGSWERQVFNFS